MSTYLFTFTREQRVAVDVEAENLEEATKLAWDKIKDTDLFSPADESDDVGQMWLDDIELD